MYDNSSYEAVKGAITRRIATQHVDLLVAHGPEKVLEAIEDQASFVGQVEEIGSSDISCWVHSIERRLGAVVQS